MKKMKLRADLCRHEAQCDKHGCNADCIADHATGPTGTFVEPDLKDTNPKDFIGADKLPMHLVPDTAVALACLAHLDGALKYGAWNWRVAGVKLSIYRGALMRHLAAWWNGEDTDPDSGLPHLAHAMACLNIIADATVAEKITDDRPPRIDLRGQIADLTPMVAKLRAKHADAHPVHYTINAGVSA